MRLLADENIAPRTVLALRAAGHDVRHVREDRRGLSDRAVAALAFADRRVLVTSDKDFGFLLFRGGVTSRGVVPRGSLPRARQHASPDGPRWS